MLAPWFNHRRDEFRKRGEHTPRRAVFDLVDRFLYSSTSSTVVAPHVRDSLNIQRLMNNFVIASLPCLLIGLWNLGEQTNLAMEWTGVESLPGWRGAVLDGLGIGYDPYSVAACMLHGLLYFLPIYLTALLTGAFWEGLFAVKRERRIDEGLLYVAWLYSLIMPPTASPLQVALGMTFAIVVGKAIFGGVGRYLISPPILGIAFLVFSYSSLIFSNDAWIPLPGYTEPTTITLSVEEGGVAALESVGYSWLQLFIGNQPGPIGVTSPLGCLLGALFLVFSGTVSWRIIVGSVLGMIVTVLLFNNLGPADDPGFSVPWYWHAVMGGWAFGTVFLATDPVAAGTTNAGRWGFGVLVGTLTIIIRVTNPSYYEGVIFAILLASIFAPLIDYAVVQRNIRRRAARLAASA